ncbi:MAG: hypothetical protein JRH08_14045 [Deltaproteobacteria bacterium]|nr:hypothetical protein [Deltaproteobacteria bacterium]MBW1929364.1 hypothetical protein [Deltaproteobacteria bacterium]MBW2026047.1 hypothetical protein [Deltaproteobacteria bacterium]MBW2126767.1 hypothetical protein [Deltaproteobacteria bacterium]RLB21803.1 MAG: hypothetical protein DRG76_08210 [Deltaproteobacteria bacterium]
MSVRIQVILEEKEAARFRAKAAKESKSLSAWLRDAGRKMLEMEKNAQLTDEEALRAFFQKSNEREKEGTESDWEEHKKMILDGFSSGQKL